MARLINLRTFSNERGKLTVIEKVLPFDVKRVFYIYGVDNSVRGGHRHRRTRQAAVCLQGQCTIYNHDGSLEETFRLDRPDQCLILEPQDWHEMFNFSEDAILLILASEYFDEHDYIHERY